MIRNWSIAQKIALGLALGPVALVLLGLVSFLNTSGLLEAEHALLQSYDVRLAISSSNRARYAAESNERGYLLTGDQTFLVAYQTAIDSISKQLDTIAQLTTSNPDQQALIFQLRGQVAERLSEYQEAIDARRTRGFAAAAAVLLRNRTKNVDGQIGQTMTALLVDQQKKQAELQAADQRWATRTVAAIAFRTIVAVVFLAIIAFVLIRNVSAPLHDAVSKLATAVSDILAGTAQQATGVQEQAAAVAETVTTVEQIAQTADASNDRARAVAESAQRAVENGVAGRRAVEDTVAVMADVKARTESIASNILALAERAQAIGEIIAVVTDVADQTNILALNAAIEASRAGEHGRGFAVVAAEVKALAEQSKKATVQVRQILSEIQRATNSTVIATEQGAKTVDEAIRTVNDADDAIRSLAAVVAEAAQAATQISASVNQQNIGIAQIRRAMHDINETTAQSLASTRQAEQAARDLDGLGNGLRRLLRGTAT